MNWLLWGAMVTTTLALAGFIYLSLWTAFWRRSESSKPPRDD